MANLFFRFQLSRSCILIDSPLMPTYLIFRSRSSNSTKCYIFLILKLKHEALPERIFSKSCMVSKKCKRIQIADLNWQSHVSTRKTAISWPAWWPTWDLFLLMDRAVWIQFQWIFNSNQTHQRRHFTIVKCDDDRGDVTVFDSYVHWRKFVRRSV